MAKITLNALGKKKFRLIECTKCHEPWQTDNRCQRICPECRKEKAIYQKQRAAHKRNLPYYLKTEI